MSASTLSLRLSSDARDAIERLAALEHTTVEDAILSAVRRRLAEISEPPNDTRAESLLDRLEAVGVVGTFDGPEDLSTNPSHLDGFGE